MIDQKPVKEDPFVRVAESAHPSGRDGRLQAVRRIDWRFLLPDPRLGRVAYLGPTEGTLFKTLSEYSDSLTVISSPDLQAPERNAGIRFDLLVLHSTQVTDLDKAKPLLREGGYLYWEIDRTISVRSFKRSIMGESSAHLRHYSLRKAPLNFLHFRYYQTVLQGLSFCRIRANWHRPNFDSCLEIIPLDEPLALDYVFSRGSGKLSGQIKSIIGRSLTKTDLLGRIVPCLSLLAQAPASAQETR